MSVNVLITTDQHNKEAQTTTGSSNSHRPGTRIVMARMTNPANVMSSTDRYCRKILSLLTDRTPGACPHDRTYDSWRRLIVKSRTPELTRIDAYQRLQDEYRESGDTLKQFHVAGLRVVEVFERCRTGIIRTSEKVRDSYVSSTGADPKDDAFVKELASLELTFGPLSEARELLQKTLRLLEPSGDKKTRLHTLKEASSTLQSLLVGPSDVVTNGSSACTLLLTKAVSLRNLTRACRPTTQRGTPDNSRGITEWLTSKPNDELLLDELVQRLDASVRFLLPITFPIDDPPDNSLGSDHTGQIGANA